MSAERIGKYELIDRIGAGGMAEIHLARVVGDLGFEKLVVIKRLLPELAADPELLIQFTDEARLVATFSHTNVVTTFDFGRVDGSFYLAMEYIQGKNLRVVQAALEGGEQRLPVAAAVFIVAEICRGLDYVHHLRGPDGKMAGIVHRDVSPHNVLVGYNGDVKVLDFGIAKHATRTYRTTTGTVKGKLRYMSPEQLAGNDVDARSDLYSAGVVLWELLFGKRPMPDLADADLIDWAGKALFERGTSPLLDPELEGILSRALAPDPKDRYPSCGQMAEALSFYNTVHWPDFSRGSLARLMDSTFTAEIRREQTRLGRRRAELAGEVAPGGEGPSVQTGPEGTVESVSSVPRREETEHSLARGPVRTEERPSSSGRSRPGTVSHKPPAEGMQVVPAPFASPRSRARRTLLLLPFLFVAIGLGLALGPTRWLVHPTPETASPVPSAPGRAPSAEATTASLARLSPIGPPALSRHRLPPRPSGRALSVASPAISAPLPSSTPFRSLAPTPVPRPTAWITVGVDAATGFAEVWVDGKRVSEETPLMNYPVTAGEAHTVEVVRGTRRRAERVTLTPGDRRTLDLSLPQ